MILVPTPASARYLPDFMELEALAGALGQGSMHARFSDASGRERASSSWPALRKAASGVVIVETAGTRIVTSEAPFALADARCPCGEDALVGIHEVYKRTHGGVAPSRLLRATGLGRALRGRCLCGERLFASTVRSAVASPFARVAVFGPSSDERLRRVTGFSWREV